MATSHLFLDPRVIASTANAKLELGRVQKRAANPLFVEDFFAVPPKRWEARLDNVYPSVITTPKQAFSSAGTSPSYMTSRPITRRCRSAQAGLIARARAKRACCTPSPPTALTGTSRPWASSTLKARPPTTWSCAARPTACMPAASSKTSASPTRRGHTSSSIAMPALAAWRPASPPMDCAGLSRCYGTSTTPSATATIMRSGRPSASAMSASPAAGRMAYAPYCAAKAPTSSTGRNRSRSCAALDAHDQIYSLPICHYGNLYIGCPRFSTKATRERRAGTRSIPSWQSASTASIGSASARARP